MRILRWIDEPPDVLAWEYNPDDTRPLIHPEDEQKAARLSDDLATAAARAHLRLRGHQDAWIPADIDAYLVALDQHATAALLEVNLQDAAGAGVSL